MNEDASLGCVPALFVFSNMEKKEYGISLYKRVCPSVHPSVRLSVRNSFFSSKVKKEDIG